LNVVEINSSFYRDHKPATYAKWSACVPDDFRFSVKLSRYFTQETRLEDAGQRLRETLNGIAHLEHKLGVLLVQLPPSLAFDPDVAGDFIQELREQHSGDIAWEPRHPSWSLDDAVEVLEKYEITRVFADPEPCPISDERRQRLEFFRYWRLHGTPEIYRSRYNPDTIENLARALRSSQKPVWCIFDNTTFGFATENALELQRLLTAPANQELTL